MSKCSISKKIQFYNIILALFCLILDLQRAGRMIYTEQFLLSLYTNIKNYEYNYFTARLFVDESVISDLSAALLHPVSIHVCSSKLVLK